MTLWLAEDGCKSQGPKNIRGAGDIRDQCRLSGFERMVCFEPCKCLTKNWDGPIPSYVNMLEAQRLPMLDGTARVLLSKFSNSRITRVLEDCITWSDALRHLRVIQIDDYNNNLHEMLNFVCKRKSCLRLYIFKAFSLGSSNPDPACFAEIEPYIYLEHEDLSMTLRKEYVGGRERLKDVGPLSELECYKSFIDSPADTDGHRERVLVIITSGPGERTASVWIEGVQEGPRLEGKPGLRSGQRDRMLAHTNVLEGGYRMHQPRIGYEYLLCDTIESISLFYYDDLVRRGACSDVRVGANIFGQLTLSWVPVGFAVRRETGGWVEAGQAHDA